MSNNNPQRFLDPAYRTKARLAAPLLGEPAASEFVAALDCLEILTQRLAAIEPIRAELEEFLSNWEDEGARNLLQWAEWALSECQKEGLNEA